MLLRSFGHSYNDIELQQSTIGLSLHITIGTNNDIKDRQYTHNLYQIERLIMEETELIFRRVVATH